MADDPEFAGLAGLQPSEADAAAGSAADDVTPRKRPYPQPSSAGRSANMRANRRTDTGPELALRRALHGRGYRYRKDHRLDLAPGVRVRPDIVFTARKVAVFVDGCFWHCCPEHGTQPAANTWYWAPKLRRNIERDRAADEALGQAGWTVIRLWEHESLDAAVAAVTGALARPPESAYSPKAVRSPGPITPAIPDLVQRAGGTAAGLAGSPDSPFTGH
ncbi:MAG TPA: very short patch repair endonuclease [Streptosporangiaceae bacterium]|nr:very short patch repair endonuclease [Streptosporangiaceae bacterium]